VNRKIILLLATVTFSLAAYEARIHNCTGYNFEIKEWKTIGCKRIQGFSLPKDSTQTLKWGACVTTGARFGTTIVNNVVDNVLVFKRDITGSYEWFIFAEQPQISVEDPLHPGQPVITNKFVRFFLWKKPAPAAPKALFAVSKWLNTITGLIDEAGAKAAGLKSDDITPEI